MKKITKYFCSRERTIVSQNSQVKQLTGVNSYDQGVKDLHEKPPALQQSVDTGVKSLALQITAVVYSLCLCYSRTILPLFSFKNMRISCFVLSRFPHVTFCLQQHALVALVAYSTRICAAEMAVRYAALSACRKVHP